MLKNFIHIIIFLSVFQISSQENLKQFPQDYFGIYKGDLIIINASGEQKIQMEFHLQPTDSVGYYIYKMVYIFEGNRQERNYTLIEKNRITGEYVVDENNGILLDAKFLNGTLFSMFEVQGNILTTTERFHENAMDFTITFSPKAQSNISKSTGNEPVDVVSYPITVVQFAKLIKE
jgi:hypothetical protein